MVYVWYKPFLRKINNAGDLQENIQMGGQRVKEG